MTTVSRLLDRLRALAALTRPVDEAAAAATARRWQELPDHVKTPAQIVGRRTTGCEGTHGVFPACDFACKPCYHSRDANKVRIDGPHTVAAVREQVAFHRTHRAPGSYAQLIGGEVSLLSADDHAEALAVMWEHGRVPMSMTHGDFDESYARSLVLDGDRPRFPSVSFAAHIDTTMHGRRGAVKPARESDLDSHRARFCAMFERLRRDHGVRSYLAHNMTVTPANLDQIAAVVAANRHVGFRMFSFQPAAYVGNEHRWSSGYRDLTGDAVWAEVERGAGGPLPYRGIQFGDLRCNRVSWGLYVGDRYVPVIDEDHPADLATRDLLFETLPGNYLAETRRWVKAARLVRLVVSRPDVFAAGVGWAARLVRRAGGPLAFRHRAHRVTFVMHRFMDAQVVAPAWDHIRSGTRAIDPAVVEAQERLEACVYSMAHPETGELVPACVQHSVLDQAENARLAVELPLPVRRRS